MGAGLVNLATAAPALAEDDRAFETLRTDPALAKALVEGLVAFLR